MTKLIGMYVLSPLCPIECFKALHLLVTCAMGLKEAGSKKCVDLIPSSNWYITQILLQFLDGSGALYSDSASCRAMPSYKLSHRYEFTNIPVHVKAGLYPSIRSLEKEESPQPDPANHLQ